MPGVESGHGEAGTLAVDLHASPSFGCTSVAASLLLSGSCQISVPRAMADMTNENV